MTVVPGVERDTVNIICNRCGEVLEAVDSMLRDADVVWPLITKHGWAGSPFAVGPHHCPSCVTAPLMAPRSQRPLLPKQESSIPCRPRIQYQTNAAVVTLRGDIDCLSAEILRQTLTTAIAERHSIVLDLADVGLIDATGLGVLVRAHREARRYGGTFCLAAPSRFIITVLHTMRLDTLFPMFDDRQQALTWLAANSLSPAQGLG